MTLGEALFQHACNAVHVHYEEMTPKFSKRHYEEGIIIFVSVYSRISGLRDSETSYYMSEDDYNELTVGVDPDRIRFYTNMMTNNIDVSVVPVGQSVLETV